uniref:triacylglycerol lipase n=1 Tax=Wickerhamomyces lynferdii TaxID=1041609 RepID=A0A0M4MFE2_9ASCO|nr:lipase 1 [Wickerhamomyces lynferdii]
MKIFTLAKTFLTLSSLAYPAIGLVIGDKDKDQSEISLNYSDFVYKTLFKNAHLQKVSYCSYESTFYEGPLSEACPNMAFCQKSDDLKIVGIYSPSIKEKQISGTAYVAIDEENEKVHVVFRGTLSPGDAVTDITFLQCPYVPVLSNDIDYKIFENISRNDDHGMSQAIKDHTKEKTPTCEGCLVHCGVYIEFTKFIGEIAKTIEPYMKKDYSLIVTGHSLGAGYALLGGLEFQLLGYDPMVITYASLRVGDPAFNVWVDELFATEKVSKLVEKGGKLPFPSLSRAYQATDIVPRLPPALPGIVYTHAGLQFQINKVRLPHLKKDVIFKGPTDNFKNDGIDLKLQPGIFLPYYQHTHQFIRIAWPCDDSEMPFP